MKRIDFKNGTVTNNILSAALPMLVAQILNLLYNIVDRIYIARIQDVGTTALGAVGLCFPIIMIITAFSNLFGSGGAPIFSINRGKGDSRTADMIMNTAFTMLCGSAAVLMLIGFLFARPLLTLFGASDDALVYAYPYLMIYLLGTLPSMIATGMNPFINAQGYAIIGMLSVTVGAVANIILDPIFIFVLDMGEPVKILDLAKNLILLSGHKPDEDIQIVFTGLRPGEKLYEEMLMDEEGLQDTENNLIHIGKPIELDEGKFLEQLEELKEYVVTEPSDIREWVKKIVPTYQPKEE